MRRTSEGLVDTSMIDKPGDPGHKVFSMDEKVQKYNETVVSFIEEKMQQYQARVVADFNDMETNFQEFFYLKGHQHYINCGIVKMLGDWHDFFSFGEHEKMTEPNFYNYLTDREQEIVYSLNKWEKKMMTESPYICTTNPLKNISYHFDREVTQQMISILKSCLNSIKCIKMGL